jgi:dihydrofolate reductase
MTQFKAFNISVSEDGFMAGPHQSLEAPLGIDGQLLHTWAFKTQSFQKWHGEGDGEVGIDNDFIEAGYTNIGATIMGRNMFGPIRGEWPNDEWKGWWGDSPGFQHPVFVLTRYPRETIDMGNGTRFTFVTEGIEKAHELALQAANGKDVRVGGGASTIQQFMLAGLLDSIHVAQISINLGSGELLFADKENQLKQYQELDSVISDSVIHLTYVKR